MPIINLSASIGNRGGRVRYTRLDISTPTIFERRQDVVPVPDGLRLRRWRRWRANDADHS